MSSWVEPQYESYPNQPYLHPLDVPDGSMREAEHPPSLVAGYSYTPRPSPNSSRQTYSPGFYGPRPQPPHPEPIQGLPTPAMVPRSAMSDLEEADDEYMEVEPMADSGVPLYSSDFDDEPQLQGKRRFVGGFIRGLKKIPKAMRRARGFSPQKRELPTPPGLTYHESQYIDDIEPQESEAAPPYDAPSDHVEGDLRYTDGINMPAEFTFPSPSLTPSHTIHAPRSESQLTYESLTNPPARHVSHHGSLHHAQRPSPSPPRTVRNPDPPSPTDGSGTANANSPRFEQPPVESERNSAYRTPHLSPLAPARRPTVTVQSPTGSPVYFEPPPTEDYAGMDMDSLADHSPEPSAPTQLSRMARFVRDLRNLPWISPNVTVDFDPTDAERARYAHTQGTGKSWYTGHLQNLDLLADSSTRTLTSHPGHAFGPAPGSSATLAPLHGSGSASNSSEGASAHLPTAPILPPYPYPVQTLALPPQPLYYYPFQAMPPPPPQQQQQPIATAPELVSQQSSGNSDVPKQPFFYVVAMPPGYPPGPVDPSRLLQPTFGVPYPPPI